MTGKQPTSSDDAPPPQSSLSASALLKEHEKVMKKSISDKKHLQETSCDAHVDDHRLTKLSGVTASKVTDRNSDAVPASTVESKNVKGADGTEPSSAERQQHTEAGDTLKQVVKPRYGVPELGRGLNVSCTGFVDLDDIPCSSLSSDVTPDNAKVSITYRVGGPKKLHTVFMAITLSTLNHFS